MGSFKQMVRGVVNLALSPFGLEIRRRNSKEHFSETFSPKPVISRGSMAGVLEHCKKLGFFPKTILDIGAAAGTQGLYDVFPDARIVLIEPLEEFKPALEKLVQKYPNASYVLAAVAREAGNITIHVHPDLVGSSFYLEEEDSDVNGVPRVVPAVSVDDVCREKQLEGPYLIKVDVQGAELEVLSGAQRVLKEAQVVILEAVLFRFFVGGYQFFEIVQYMKDQGFVVYDIFDPWYRPLDGALSQVDIAFVKETGMFRKTHSYATREQRERQTRWIMDTLRSESQNMD